MNTLIVVSGWQGGGTERYVELLAEVHRKVGWIPHLVLLTKPKAEIAPVNWHSITIVSDREKSAQKIMRLCRDLSIKMVHMNVWTHWGEIHTALKNSAICTLQTYHATFPLHKSIGLLELWHPGHYGMFVLIHSSVQQ